MSIAVFI